MNKKCNFCDNTTSANREDLHEKEWSAFQIGKEKTIYGCHEHNEELRQLMLKQLSEKANILEGNN